MRTTFAPGTFDATDALARAARARPPGLSGGMIRIVAADGAVIHEHTIGSVSGAHAPAGRVVDQVAHRRDVHDLRRSRRHRSRRRHLAVAARVRRFDPADHARASCSTTRRACATTRARTTAPRSTTCVRTLASSPREFPAGTRFSYGNAPFLVVGRLIEVLGGADFATVVRERLTGPLGMAGTDVAGRAVGAQPGVRRAGHGRRLRDAPRHAPPRRDGDVDARVLSAAAVREIVTNQVAAYDTSHDYSVGITQIPRYGLGCWPDVRGPVRTTTVVSGNGGKGFYPWVDFTTRTWGIVGVQDDRGARARGAGVAAGGGGGAHRGQPVTNPVGCRTGMNP